MYTAFSKLNLISVLSPHPVALQKLNLSLASGRCCFHVLLQGAKMRPYSGPLDNCPTLALHGRSSLSFQVLDATSLHHLFPTNVWEHMVTPMPFCGHAIIRNEVELRLFTYLLSTLGHTEKSCYCSPLYRALGTLQD